MTSAHILPAATIMRRLIKTYLSKYIGLVSLAFLFMAMAAAMTATIAKLMQPVLDDVLGKADERMIIPVALAVFATFAVRGFAGYMHTILLNRISQYVIGDIQKDIFSHFLKMDLSFFHDTSSGHMTSSVINDVNVVRMALSDTLMGAGKNFLTLIFLTVVMVYQDWQLSIAALLILPFVVAMIAIIGRRLRKISRTTQEETGALTSLLSQSFQGIRQIKAYGMEDHEKRRTGARIERVRSLNIKAVRIGNILTPVNEILVGVVVAGIIVYGGHQIADGEMTTGQMASFLAAFTLAYEPVKRIARANNMIQMGLGAADRIFKILDTPSTITEKSDAANFSNPAPAIEFTNVSFKYRSENTASALHNVSFTARPGAITALVGPSGGGKTTCMNLIPRFYDVSSGVIMIGGHDLRDYNIASLRSHIALVSQDITIFDDSVADNIAYGKPSASRAEIEAAARTAAAHDFIIGLAEGYDTKLGEDGVKLSGGQRQRIALARAVLRDAPILLLDEATSALDNESEKAVQDALNLLGRNRTTLIIAHRLSTIQQADHIIVMEMGRIVEIGSHESLMAANGLYTRMYNAGFANGDKP